MLSKIFLYVDAATWYFNFPQFMKCISRRLFSRGWRSNRYKSCTFPPILFFSFSFRNYETEISRFTSVHGSDVTLTISPLFSDVQCFAASHEERALIIAPLRPPLIPFPSHPETLLTLRTNRLGNWKPMGVVIGRKNLCDDTEFRVAISRVFSWLCC